MNKRYRSGFAAFFTLAVSACAAISQQSGGDAIPPSVIEAAASQIDFSSPTETWAFQPEPDDYDKRAKLDLRYLNEKVAGKSGFVRLSPNGQDFVRGDGQPIRFWAVNSYVWRKGTAALQDNARFLAKRGVNMVRWHGQIAANTPESQLTDIDKTARDQLWQAVAAMKREGIYLTVSPYYAFALEPKPQWGIPRDSKNLHGLLFFDPKLQAAYKQWLRQLLEPVNPYTGIPLKDEPAIALIQLQNEDSLLFWTVSQIQGRDLDLLSRQFGDWLQKKYGSLEKASQAWQGASVKGDDFDRGLVGFNNLWEMTRPQQPDGGRGKRFADQTEFWTETMRQFNGGMARFLRQEIGAKQLINAGNWRTADTARLNDAERYSYTATEVLGVNRYYTGGIHQGKYSSWAIVNGDRFSNRSVLFDPLALPINLKQVAAHPIVVPESSWVPPLGYQSEAPFIVAAFQSLSGVDGFYWFAMNEPQWQQPASANGYLPSLGKWIINTPELLGNFPAAALMYRQGYIQQGQPVVRERRSLEDLWQRRLPLISEEPAFDPNRDQEIAGKSPDFPQGVNPLAFLVGAVEVTYGTSAARSQVLDLSPYINRKLRTVRSNTGELTWNYGQGTCILDTPKAQGATGFLKTAGEIKLSQVTIDSGNDYATVLAVSLDGQPLSQSRKLLVQVGTIARPTGWQQRQTTWKDDNGQQLSGFEVVDYGRAPWRLVRNNLAVAINNPSLTQATVLDMNGMARGKVPLKRDSQKVSLRFPADAMYLLLE
jgi:hypothetical protein